MSDEDHRAAAPGTLSSGEITQLLVRVRSGDPGGAEALYGRVCDRLRQLARQRLRGASTPTLDVTSLVHEAAEREIRQVVALAAETHAADRRLGIELRLQPRRGIGYDRGKRCVLENAMPSAVQLEAARLVIEERWAALATLEHGVPTASMVAYAVEPTSLTLVMLLSGLSAHTRQLIADPRASLAISRPDPGEGDPQRLPRVTIAGAARPLEPGSAEYGAASATYLQRFPGAAMRFALPDFVLFAFSLAEVRYVGGFARAATFDAATFSAVLAEAMVSA